MRHFTNVREPGNCFYVSLLLHAVGTRLFVIEIKSVVPRIYFKVILIFLHLLCGGGGGGDGLCAHSQSAAPVHRRFQFTHISNSAEIHVFDCCWCISRIVRNFPSVCLSTSTHTLCHRFAWQLHFPFHCCWLCSCVVSSEISFTIQQTLSICPAAEFPSRQKNQKQIRGHMRGSIEKNSTPVNFFFL